MEQSDQLLYLFQFSSAGNVLAGELETTIWILVFVAHASAVVNVAGGEGLALINHLALGALGVAVGLGGDEGVVVALVNDWRILAKEIALQGFGHFALQFMVALSVVKGLFLNAWAIIVLHGLIQHVIWTGTLATNLGQVLEVLVTW